MFITTTDPKDVGEALGHNPMGTWESSSGDNLDFNNFESFRFKKNEDSK